jgi:hypothetical protein
MKKMSGDVFSSIDPSELEPVVYEQYCHLRLYKELYCTYTGYCERNRATNNKDMLCLMCEHRKLLDIPAMINKELGK